MNEPPPEPPLESPPEPPQPSSLKPMFWLLLILAVLGLLIWFTVSDVWPEWFSVAEGAAIPVLHNVCRHSAAAGVHIQ